MNARAIDRRVSVDNAASTRNHEGTNGIERAEAPPVELRGKHARGLIRINNLMQDKAIHKVVNRTKPVFA